YFQDDFAAARAYDEQALAIARAAGDMAAEAHALDALGSDASEQGDYGAAAGYYERAAALFRAVGDQWGLCANLGNLAFLQREQGNYGRALASCAEGLALARAIGDRRIEGWFLGCRGWVLLDLGAYGEADGAFAEGLAVCEAAANHSNAEWVRSGVALLRCLQGAYAEGEARARAVREAALDGRRSRVGDAAICLGHALAGQGRLAEAGAAYAEALAVWEELGRPARAVEARAGLADAALRAGDLAGALAPAGPILAQLAAGPPTGADEPLRVYWAAWRALAASADPRAGPLRAEALALLEARAALIADPALRHSYLDEVAAHRELRAHGPGPL
ncbi:MAG TPA: tetratricopeptide repeat protein, partial [Chloroflexaceae bacterium]|nr:tetratricopeptide repeat protein [Chloroflexaceae bacterium]